MKKFYTTKFCRLCLNKKIKVGLKLVSMTLGEKYSKNQQDTKKSKKFPLSVGWCGKCKNVQTMEIVDPKFLWSDFTYLTSQTKAIVDHFKLLSKNIINKFKIRERDLIIDIGSNDGTFLNFFKKKNCKVLGVDPALNVVKIARRKGITSICSFFNKGVVKKIRKKYNKAKLITCFNTFAHAPNMREIVFCISEILDNNGIFVFECQYLSDIYKKKILGTIFHEHMYHHSVTSLNNLFNTYDLQLFDVERVNIQKGSIIGYVCKKNTRQISSKVKRCLKREHTNGDTSYKKLTNFSNFIRIQKKNALKILNNYKISEVGAYGSARSGPTYAFNFGLFKKFGHFFDDHPLKVNKFSFFNGYKVLETKKIDVLRPKILIILAYLHSKKIIRKNLKYLRKGGKFLIVYPKISLVNKRNYKKFI